MSAFLWVQPASCEAGMSHLPAKQEADTCEHGAALRPGLGGKVRAASQLILPTSALMCGWQFTSEFPDAWVGMQLAGDSEPSHG